MKMQIQVPAPILEAVKAKGRPVDREINGSLCIVDRLHTYAYSGRYDHNTMYYEPCEEQFLETKNIEIKIEIDDFNKEMMDNLIEDCESNGNDLFTLLWIELIEDNIRRIDEKDPTTKHLMISVDDDYSKIISYCLWADLLEEQIEQEETQRGG